MPTRFALWICFGVLAGMMMQSGCWPLTLSQKRRDEINACLRRCEQTSGVDPAYYKRMDRPNDQRSACEKNCQNGRIQ